MYTDRRSINAVYRANLSRLFKYAIVLWTIINSGSLIFIDFWQVNTAINYICISFLFFTYLATKYVAKQGPIQLLSKLVFVIILFMFMMVSLILHKDSGAFISYIQLAMAILWGLILSEWIEIELFGSIYANIMLYLAIISLLFFSLGSGLESLISNVKITYNQNVPFKNLYVYLYSIFNPNRNMGIFWEPGAFQAFLNIGLIQILFAKKRRNRFIKSLILLIAIYTTFSTTGYIVSVLILCAYAFKNRDVKDRGWQLLFISAFILVILTSPFYVSNLSNKFSPQSGRSLSYETRVNSTLLDLMLMTKNPVIGVGLGAYMQEFDDISNMLNKYADSAPNTFTQLGAMFGALFLSIILFGFLRYPFSFDTGILSKLLLAISVFTIFCSENFYHLPLFYVLIFYGLNRRNKVNELDQNNLRQSLA